MVASIQTVADVIPDGSTIYPLLLGDRKECVRWLPISLVR